MEPGKGIFQCQPIKVYCGMGKVPVTIAIKTLLKQLYFVQNTKMTSCLRMGMVEPEDVTIIKLSKMMCCWQKGR